MRKLGILLIALSLAPAVRADTLVGENPPVTLAEVAADTATVTSDSPPPPRYCKPLPSPDEAVICEEECCQAAAPDQPLNDCNFIAYPCNTRPPL